MSELVVHPLAPVFDKDSQVLILGSFPSVMSRKAGFYYAHPRNRFWSVIAALFDEKITDREEFCHRHHIALWDVIHSCTIENSADASIRNVIPNDIQSILKNSRIHIIFTTGRKADQLYRKYMDTDLPHTALPSTSAANAAMSRDDLIKAYSIVRENIYEQ